MLKYVIPKQEIIVIITVSFAFYEMSFCLQDHCLSLLYDRHGFY